MTDFGSPMEQLDGTAGNSHLEETEAEKIGLTEDDVNQGMAMAAHEMAQKAPLVPIHRPGPTPIPRTQWEEAMRQQKEREGSVSLPGMPPPDDRLERLEKSVVGLAQVVTSLVQQHRPEMQPAPTFPAVAPGGTISQPGMTAPGPEPMTSDLGQTSQEITGPRVNPATPEDTISRTPEGETIITSTNPSLTPSGPQEQIEPETVNFEEKVAELVEQRVARVEAWLQRREPYKVFNDLVRAAHKNLGFHSWPPEMQREWSRRFQNVLTNRKMLRKVIRAVLRMHGGTSVGENGLAALAVLMSGCVALYTLEGEE